MANASKQMYGVTAEFAGTAELLEAARAVRGAGYRQFDCHSPFPIHGMDEAMALRRSPVGWIAGVCAFGGAVVAMALQWWTSAVDYPIVSSGKPLFSYQAFVPITFEVAVLSAAVGAVGAMLLFSRLPTYFHHLFYGKRFPGFSDDRFLVSVDAVDRLFDPQRTAAFLTSIGGQNVELIEGA